MTPQRPQHTRRTVKNRNGSHANELVPAISDITGFDASMRAKFCELYEQDGTFSTACARTGVGRVTVRQAIRDDLEFRAMFEGAHERLVDKILRETYRRGVEGVSKPVYFKGERVDKDGENREFSDALLIKLLERHVPEFRTKTQVDSRNVNVDLGAVDLRSLSPRQQEKLRELLLEPPDDATPTESKELGPHAGTDDDGHSPGP